VKQRDDGPTIRVEVRCCPELAVAAKISLFSWVPRCGALDAFARYGEGRGHPAQLNPGDCFAYAVAKTFRTSLLFKGDDFGKTDAKPASAEE
jgi:ribonuclease VapC